MPLTINKSLSALCGGLLLAGCAGSSGRPNPPGPYAIYPPMQVTPEDAAALTDSQRRALMYPQFFMPAEQIEAHQALEAARAHRLADSSWTHDAVTAGMTVGGLEAMQRLKAVQAARAAEKLPAPELPAPAVEGAAGAAAERKLAGNLLTREGAAVAAGAAERKAAGTLLMRGAIAAEEGEGLGLLLRLLLFL